MKDSSIRARRRARLLFVIFVLQGVLDNLRFLVNEAGRMPACLGWRGFIFRMGDGPESHANCTTNSGIVNS
eukprot:6876256-Pyramimonas_sp.AAC.1